MRRALVAVLLSGAVPVLAGSDPPLPVQRAVLFKNGIGFLTRSVRVELRSGWATLPEVPRARHGSLWLSVEGGTVDEVVAATEPRHETRPAASLDDLLWANPGRTVTLSTRTGGTHTGALRPLEGPAQENAGPGPSFVLLESGGRFQAVPRAEVVGATFAEAPLLSAPRPGKREVLRLRSGTRDGSARVTLSDLEKGVGWTPQYVVRLEEGGRARLEMQALLVNDAADLRDAEVLFAVGYPSFAFAEVPTPLDVSRGLAEFFSQLRRGHEAELGPLANVMSQTVVAPRGRPASAEGDYDSATTAEETRAEQDLFLYTRKGVTLARGERGSYPLITATVPVSHVFDWEIPAGPEPDEVGARARGGAASLEQVWHSLRLENGSRFPWTTGPALVLGDSGPVAQGTLHYTAPGAATLLRLTVAPDLSAERDEREVGRVAGALRRFGHTWDALTVEGTLRLTSRRAEAVELSVRKTLQGTVASAGEGGRDTRLATQPSAVNPTSRLEWSLRLEPGVTRTITYRYTVYVRG